MTDEKRSSRFIKWGLTCSLAAGMLSGCSSAKPQVHLNLTVPAMAMNSVLYPEYQDAYAFLAASAQDFAGQYDKADVSFDVNVFEYVDEQEAIVGSFDTEHAADVLYEGYFNMAGYVHTGRVVPLDDVISEELKEDIYPSYWAMSKFDGKTYMMPYLAMENIMIYNKDLFRQAGLESYISDDPVIANWSLEDWEIILDTLAANLPEGVYPTWMYASNNQGDTHHLIMMRMFGADYFDEQGNFDFEQPEIIEALTWIQQGIDRGWYPPNPQNLEMTDNMELFYDNRLALYIINNTNFILLPEDLSAYGFVNFPGNHASSFVTGFQVFDNGDPLTVQTAKDYVRFIMENEKWKTLSVGNLPASKEVTQNNADRIFMLEAFSQNDDQVVDFMKNTPNWQGNDNSVRSVLWPWMRDLLAQKITPEECAAGLQKDLSAALAYGRANSTLHE